MSDQPNPDLLLQLTTQIVSAHVGNNQVGAGDVPAVIQSVHRALSGLGSVPVEAEKPQPAVPIKKSIFPDHIVCLECGKSMKMLKRHLHTDHAMTPEEYRARWNLPTSYPVVAPAYAEKRSSLAKEIGLGKKPRVEEELEPVKASSKRGRKLTAAE